MIVYSSLQSQLAEAATLSCVLVFFIVQDGTGEAGVWESRGVVRVNLAGPYVFVRER